LRRGVVVVVVVVSIIVVIVVGIDFGVGVGVVVVVVVVVGVVRFGISDYVVAIVRLLKFLLLLLMLEDVGSDGGIVLVLMFDLDGVVIG